MTSPSRESLLHALAPLAGLLRTASEAGHRTQESRHRRLKAQLRAYEAQHLDRLPFVAAAIARTLCCMVLQVNDRGSTAERALSPLLDLFEPFAHRWIDRDDVDLEEIRGHADRLLAARAIANEDCGVYAAAFSHARRFSDIPLTYGDEQNAPSPQPRRLVWAWQKDQSILWLRARMPGVPAGLRLRAELLIEVAWAAPMRTNELLYLRARDVLLADTVVVSLEPSAGMNLKTSRARREIAVPLPGPARATMEDLHRATLLRGQHAYIFSMEDDAPPSFAASHALLDLAQEALRAATRDRGTTISDLRASAVSHRLADASRNEPVDACGWFRARCAHGEISASAGHASLATTGGHYHGLSYRVFAVQMQARPSWARLDLTRFALVAAIEATSTGTIRKRAARRGSRTDLLRVRPDRGSGHPTNEEDHNRLHAIATSSPRLRGNGDAVARFVGLRLFGMSPSASAIQVAVADGQLAQVEQMLRQARLPTRVYKPAVSTLDAALRLLNRVGLAKHLLGVPGVSDALALLAAGSRFPRGDVSLVFSRDIPVVEPWLRAAASAGASVRAKTAGRSDAVSDWASRNGVALLERTARSSYDVDRVRLSITWNHHGSRFDASASMLALCIGLCMSGLTDAKEGH